MIKTLVLIVFFLLFINNAIPQENQVYFRHLDKLKGLSHNQIRCILQDQKGFIWIGTMSGLNRYDGYSFKIFRNNPEDSSSISGNSINSFFEDPDGRLWISTSNGLSIYLPEAESFVAGSQIEGLPVPSQNITDVKKDKNGNIWYLCNNNYGLLKYDVNTKKIYDVKFDLTDPTKLTSTNISTFTFDSKGDIWLVNINGIIEKIDIANLKVVKRLDALQNYYKNKQYFYYINLNRVNTG